MSKARAAALITALVALAALVVQFWVTLSTVTERQVTLGGEIWRLFGFFTILTNMTVMVVAAAIALAPGSRLSGPRVRMAVAVAIALVGIVYSVALRAQWDPQGWQAVADHGLHDAVPVLFVLTWLLALEGSLKWGDGFWAMLMPVAYCAYALIRGAADGWYPYWFIDATRLPTATMVRNIAFLASTFLLFGFLFVGIDRLVARRRRR